jgi:hypothetical protein
VFADTGEQIAAIRAIRERFGLDFRQAKEVMLQAEGVANTLAEHEERIAIAVVQALRQMEGTAAPRTRHGRYRLRLWSSKIRSNSKLAITVGNGI